MGIEDFHLQAVEHAWHTMNKKDTAPHIIEGCGARCPFRPPFDRGKLILPSPALLRCQTEFNKYVKDTAWIIIKLGHITAFGALYEIDKIFEAIVALKEISRLVSAKKRMRSEKKSQKFALR